MTLDIDQWSAFFRERVNHSSDLVKGYLNYLSVCLESKLPPIFEERHLSLLVGVPYSELGFYLSGSDKRYRKFLIPKRQGGNRVISVPLPGLLYIQKWILHNVLYKTQVSEYAHGGVPGRSIFTNAREHLSAKSLLRVDLKSFFDTIQIGFGIRFFESIGYSPHVSRSLALLCFNCGRLPQGAATSSAFANIAALSLDKRLSSLARKFDLTYTRYVDDLTFSGDFIGVKFIQSVYLIVEQCQFVVNKEKTQLARGCSPKFVTGLSVGGQQLRAPRIFKRELKNEAFRILKGGISDYMVTSEDNDPLVLERILGKLAFWIQAEPNCQTALRLFNSVLEYSRKHTTDIALPASNRNLYL